MAKILAQVDKTVIWWTAIHCLKPQEAKVERGSQEILGYRAELMNFRNSQVWYPTSYYFWFGAVLTLI